MENSFLGQRESKIFDIYKCNIAYYLYRILGEEEIGTFNVNSYLQESLFYINRNLCYLHVSFVDH